MVVTKKLAQGFATNLRFYCSQKSSIAAICREINIHRQQFNKYLSGSSFPNAHNLSVICKHLGVTAEMLFLAEMPKQNPEAGGAQIERQTPSNLPTKSDKIPIPFDSTEFGQIVSDQAQAYEPMSSGSYYCYFPFPGSDGFLLRTFLQVRLQTGRQTFSRVTRIRNSGNNTNLMAKGQHIGTVYQTQDEITLIGRNKHSPFQLSVINLERKSAFKDYYFGLAMTRAAGNAIACRTALEYLGENHPIRKTIGSLGIVQASDESVPKQIRLALVHKENTSQNLIFPPNASEILTYLTD